MRTWKPCCGCRPTPALADTDPRAARRPGPSAGGADQLAEAYEILGVPRTATDAEVKRAYRKLMSENHPDKLVARGLPESMLEVAKQKTQAIQAAWERVRESRGMR